MSVADYRRIARTQRENEHTHAMQGFRVALKRDPHDMTAMRNLAIAHLLLGHNDEALSQALRAVEMEASADSHAVLGAAYVRRGDDAEGEACFRRALELQPCNVGARLGMAELALRSGDLPRGFAGLEYVYTNGGGRFFCGSWASSGQVRNRWWDGRDISGKTLYVRWVGGHGDVIQFAARYLPILRAQGVRVLLECFSSLEPLLRLNGVADEYVTPGAYPRHDYTTTLLSLPLAMGTTLNTIPDSGGYLRAPALDEPLGDALGPRDGLRVGLVWRGNANNPSEPWRSMELAELAPLAQVEGVRLFSLQKGDGEDEARKPPHGMGSLVHLGPLLKDWTVTAAVVQELDMVVTVDTGVAHLAGALGKPVVVVLPRVAEWRWLDGWHTSPWYDSMRIYRQERLGEWGPVVTRAAEDLSYSFA